MMALLRSPHFRFQVDGAEIDRASDRGARRRDGRAALSRRPRSAARARPTRWTGAERPAAQAALGMRARTLAPLLESRPMVDQVELLRSVPRRPRPRARRSPPPRPRRRWCSALDGLIAAYRASRSVRDGHGHRAVRRHPPLAWHADVRARDHAQAASASSTRKRRASPTSTMCRSSGWSKASGPSGQRRNVFYPRRSSPQLEPSRPERIAVNEERDHVRVGARGVSRSDRPRRRADAAVDLRARIRSRGRAVVVSRRRAVVRPANGARRRRRRRARVRVRSARRRSARDRIARGRRRAPPSGERDPPRDSRARPASGCCRASASAGSSAT